MSIINHSVMFIDWGNKKIKDTFLFCEDIMDRDFPVQVRDINQVYIMAGDKECLGTVNLRKFISEYEPFAVPEKWMINNLCFDTPEDLENEKNDKKKNYEKRLRRMSQIELNKMDVVMGSEDKIKKSINSMRDEGNNNIVIGVTCLNKVIGTDMAAIMGQCHGCRITEDLNYVPQDLLKYFLLKYKDQFGKSKESKGKNKKINFLGFGQDASFLEFIQLLKYWDLQINEVVLPRVRVEDLENIYQAGLSVVNDVDYYYPIFDELKMQKMKLASPYGWDASLSWIEKIVKRFDPAFKNSLWEEYLKKRKDIWEELRQEAGKHEILFIISVREKKFLLDNTEFFSYRFNILSFLLDMGFKVRVGVLDLNGSDFEGVKRDIQKTNKSEKIIIDKISSSDEIEGYIIKSGASLLYSDLFIDDRAIALGMGTFSYSVFEMGLEGAIRSAERLLRRCQLDYYRRYKEYRIIKDHYGNR